MYGCSAPHFALVLLVVAMVSPSVGRLQTSLLLLVALLYLEQERVVVGIHTWARVRPMTIALTGARVGSGLGLVIGVIGVGVTRGGCAFQTCFTRSILKRRPVRSIARGSERRLNSPQDSHSPWTREWRREESR